MDDFDGHAVEFLDLGKAIELPICRTQNGVLFLKNLRCQGRICGD
jgi:hypothetical protein